MSPDVIALNPSLTASQVKTARVKDKKTPPDYEQILYENVIEAGLPIPLRSRGNKGPTPMKVLGIGYVADFLWVEERIIAEVNGQVWKKGGHNTGYGLQRDYYKQNLAQLLGFRYFEFSPGMVEDGTALLVLRCALGRLEVFEQNWKERQP